MSRLGRRAYVVIGSLALLLVTSFALTACGSEEGLEVEEGVPVELGPLEYNVLFTRFLNPDDTEDRAYLIGQPGLAADEHYLGVFLQVENHGDEPSPLPTQLTIVNTEDEELHSLPSTSEYALELGSEVAPDEEVPAPDSTAATGPIQGALVLFLIPDAAAELQPIHLVIPGGEEGDAEVQLDL